MDSGCHSQDSPVSEVLNSLVPAIKVAVDILLGLVLAYTCRLVYRNLGSLAQPQTSALVPAKTPSRCSSAEPRAETPQSIASSVELEDHFVDVIMTPGSPRPCHALEKYGKCSRALTGQCPDYHGISGAQKLRTYLSMANATVDIAAQAITSHQIAAVLQQLHFRGVRVRLIRDYENLAILKGTEKVSELEEIGIEIKVNGKKRATRDKDLFIFGNFHHKFIVIDGRTVISGSSNFTKKAALVNYECSVVTNIPGIVKEYVKYFDRLWNEFTPTG